MSDFPVPSLVTPAHALPKPLPAAARYGLALGLVVAAVIVAFAVRQAAGSPGVTLVFVLPVVVAATRLGFGPSILTIVGGVLAFDYLFTQPYYSLRIASPSDVWAAGLLLAIAALTGAVAAEVRRRAIASAREAVRAKALHSVAHLAAQGAPAAALQSRAADALAEIFGAPAVILVQAGDGLRDAARAGRGDLAEVDREAAAWALEHRKPVRGDSYPFENAAYNFWPLQPGSGPALVIGVGCRGDQDAWPDDPAGYVELVGGYLGAGVR